MIEDIEVQGRQKIFDMLSTVSNSHNPGKKQSPLLTAPNFVLKTKLLKCVMSRALVYDTHVTFVLLLRSFLKF